MAARGGPAKPPTNRYKQFLKLRDGSSRGPAQPAERLKCEAMRFLQHPDSFFASFFVTEITYLGPMPTFQFCTGAPEPVQKVPVTQRLHERDEEAPAQWRRPTWAIAFSRFTFLTPVGYVPCSARRAFVGSLLSCVN